MWVVAEAAEPPGCRQHRSRSKCTAGRGAISSVCGHMQLLAAAAIDGVGSSGGCNGGGSGCSGGGGSCPPPQAPDCAVKLLVPCRW